MEIDNEFKEKLAFFSAIIMLIGIFSTFYFGIAGLKVFVGIIMTSLPFYIFLNASGMPEGEKSVLSLILGLTLFPSLAFLLGFLISFRMAIAVIFILLTGISLLWNYKFKKSQIF